MRVTTKELRVQPGKILDFVSHGQEVTVTFRGEDMAKIVPLERDESKGELFGLWQDREDSGVEKYVKDMRKGRSFDY